MTIPSDIASQEFRPRAHEVSRLEAFSDVIFGFAISLLVASLEVPKHYAEFMEVFRGVLPFTLAFLIFIQIWHEHHTFFRRYALQDSLTIALNTLLLFLVLVYVYPLKYMMYIVGEQLTGHHHTDVGPPQMKVLFLIYGAGFALVFFTLAAMNLRALKLADALDLTPVERVDTRERIYDNFWEGFIGLLSVVLALSGHIALAGMVYFTICIPKTLVPSIMRRKRRLVAEAA
jgi:uncharacterized membrane protein